MLINSDTATFERGSPLLFIYLEHQVTVSDCVIPVDRPFRLNREDTLEVISFERHKGRGFWIGGLDGEPAIELAYIASLEEKIGFFGRRYLSQAQLLRESALPCAKAPLAASSGLWRVGRDHADAEVSQSTSDLGE